MYSADFWGAYLQQGWRLHFPTTGPWARAPEFWGPRSQACGSWAQARVRRQDTSATMLGHAHSRQPGLLRRLVSCAATESSKAKESRQPGLT